MNFLQIDLLDPQIKIFLVAFFGTIMGSFISLFTSRIVTGQSIIFDRSRCPHCNKALKFYNLIPIFSWILQRGKCDACHIKISIRYPLIEIAFAALFLLAFFNLGQVLDLKSLLYFLIISVLIAMCIVDLEYYFIPNILQYFLAILVVILLHLENDNLQLIDNILSGFLYLGFGVFLWLFFYFVSRIDAIGIDDLKLLFICGLIFDINSFLNFMFISGIFGMAFGSVWQLVTKEKTFPFAPSLCGAFYILLVFKDFDAVKILTNLMFF